MDRFIQSRDQDRHHSQSRPHGPYIPALMLKADDEGDQIQAQRSHPHERHHRHILTHMIRRCEQQCTRHRRQQQPQKTTPPARMHIDLQLSFWLRFSPYRRLTAVTHQPERNESKHHKPARPHPRLLPHIPAWLKEERVTQQSRQRTQIRQSIKPPGRTPRHRPREPDLCQRTRAREHKIRQSHRPQQQQ